MNLSKCTYIAAFLTYRCNLTCSYCINRVDGERPMGGELTGDEWVEYLRPLQTRDDLPITFGGGEPTLHPDFYVIAFMLRDKHLDLLTNAQFDVNDFICRVCPDTFKREAPYPAIRISYHPEGMDMAETVEKAAVLQMNHYQVGIYMVNHPLYFELIPKMRKVCEKAKVLFKTKEFLGDYNGVPFGTMKYKGCLDETRMQEFMCRTHELLIAPDGNVFNCHGDLYRDTCPVGHIKDGYTIGEYKACDHFGLCNPCDMKVKTNRFQVHGYTSNEVKLP